MLCARFADKIGYRKCVIGSQVFSAVGLIGLAFLPELLPDPFSGIIISTVIYAMGSGLTEVLVSPIVEYSKYELGKINVPIDVFIKLADYYTVSIDYLVGRGKK